MSIFGRQRVAVRRAEMLTVLGKHSGVGLWDAILHNGDAMHPQSRWTWSPEFRRLCGFADEAEFPNVVQSWSDRLHPDDVETTLSAFGGALQTGRQYETTYRLRVKNGSYRWFRATGGVIKDQNGVARRACGSLLDVHEMKEAEAADHRKQSAMDRHTQDFGSSVSGVMSGLAAAATAMRSAAEAMAGAAGGVHDEASATAGTAAKSSRDLVSVAAAVEQLTSSVDEISRQIAVAAEVSRQAVQRAEAGQNSIHGLADSTSRIGDVVRLISDIAGQTNLLALNATIEAARAGEAGRGFAVVAGEVKALATQTARATAEIGQQIETLRGATEQSVTAMTEVSHIIGKMDEVTAAISAAVEQQSASTREIASSIQDVSRATAGAVQAMEHVVAVAGDAGAVSRDVSDGAATIGQQAETLRTEVDQFLAAVNDSGNRRRYERIQTSGAIAGLRTAGREPIRAGLHDLSRGGAALTCEWPQAPGTAVTVDLPSAGGEVAARVVRRDAGGLAVVFSSEATALARIDRALSALQQVARAA